MLQSLMELPGTKGMMDLRSRADALSAWKIALQRGYVDTHTPALHQPTAHVCALVHMYSVQQHSCCSSLYCQLLQPASQDSLDILVRIQMHVCVCVCVCVCVSGRCLA